MELETSKATSFGTLLFSLRTAQNLSLSRLAKRANLSKGTLSGWERGAHKPRLPELQALMDALGSSSADREYALGLIASPQSKRVLKARLVRQEEEMGPLPSGGDLLRAMRHRRGLFLEPLASAMGISPATLSRWEQSRVIPPADRLTVLMSLLGALPEERATLTRAGSFLLPPLFEGTVTRDALWERFLALLEMLHRHTQDGLGDLGFLSLEFYAWQLAARQPSHRVLLAHIYTEHAGFLGVYNRYPEAACYAERALALLPKEKGANSFHMAAVIVSAEAAVYSGMRPKPSRGRRLLQPWLRQTTWADYEGWMLRNLANYLSLEGDTIGALRLSREACLVAESCENPEELRLRRWDQARHLVQAGQAEEVFPLVQAEPEDSPLWQTRVGLVLAAALLETGDAPAAQTWLRQALGKIALYGFEAFKGEAAALAARLAARL